MRSKRFHPHPFDKLRTSLTFPPQGGRNKTRTPVGGIQMEILTAEEKHIPEIIELWKEFMEFNSQMDPYDIMAEDGPI
jgi:hypothetical protein